VKDENDDLLADSQNILITCKNFFPHLLNVHKISDVRQIEIHAAGLLVPDPSSSEFEITIEHLKRYKARGSDEILAEVIQT
jgi:hypothetical protein